jgi:hypothetical protein
MPGSSGAVGRGAGENAFYVHVNVVVELLDVAYFIGSASSLAWSGSICGEMYCRDSPLRVT